MYDSIHIKVSIGLELDIATMANFLILLSKDNIMHTVCYLFYMYSMFVEVDRPG